MRYLLALLFFVTPAFAHTGMDGTDYSAWVRPDVGGSCCNNMDCEVAHARWIENHWEVFLDARWVVVPDEKVMKVFPHEAPVNAHICHAGNFIYCFAVGGGM